MGTKSGTNQQTERSILAGASDRAVAGVGGAGGHGRASGGTEDARRFSGIRSGERTAPLVTMSMRAAVRSEAPHAWNRNFRINSAETPPTAAAMCTSETPFAAIQSLRSIGLAPAPAAQVAPVLTPRGLSEVLAVLVSEIVSALPIADREGVLIRIANRCDDLGRLASGGDGAAMLGAVAGMLMKLEG